ncbi:MAG: leucine-rich repeat domain-containing protein, partial [Clostridia bacterium]|nr:leucine-rich repeat domain-containing protein [Clostridia bacterium]
MKKTRKGKLLALLLAAVILARLIPFGAINIFAGTTDDGWKYTLSGTTLSITGYTGSETELVVPETIGLYTVTRIGDSAFSGNKNIKSIDLSNCTALKYIGSYAFNNCSNLESISIPTYTDDNVIVNNPDANRNLEIGSTVFAGCTNLRSVYITDLAGWFDVTVGSSYGPFYYGAYLYANGELVTDIIVPDDVTSIKNYAFQGCGSLKSVDFSNCSSLTSIGWESFSRCKNLETVDFSGCSYLNVIYSSAFSGCESLESVDFSGCSALTNINQSAFYDCSNMDSVYITDVANWCKIVFDVNSSNPLCYGADLYLNGKIVKDLVIPAEVTSIKNYAFRECESLESVDFSACYNLSSIGSCAFQNCINLKNADISGCSSLTSIGWSSFSECSNLKSVDISGCSKLTNIGSSAFYKCSNLESINLSGCSALTGIGSDAFSYCSNLNSVYINDVSSWCKINFATSSSTYYSNPLSYGASLYLNGNAVEDLVIPANVTNIKDGAFYGCAKITGVDLSACTDLVSIGNYAFSYCTNLESVDFSGCTALSSIGNYAFYYCSNLESVDFSGCTALSSIGNYA